MSDPIDDLKVFFSTSKALKSKGKVGHPFISSLSLQSIFVGILSTSQANHRLQTNEQTTLGQTQRTYPQIHSICLRIRQVYLHGTLHTYFSPFILVILITVQSGNP